jgi:TonB family protein
MNINQMLCGLALIPLMMAPVTVSQAIEAVADSAEVTRLKRKTQADGRVLKKHVEPIYPRLAQIKQLVGSVTMRFTVNEDGSIGDIEITKSTPEQVFDDAAVTALSQWQYEPVKQRITGLLTRFDFRPSNL